MPLKPRPLPAVDRVLPRPRIAPAKRGAPTLKPVEAENLNPYDFALLQFERAADQLGLDPGVRAVLSRPKRQVIVSIPVKMDDGSISVSGLPVQHSIARGPSKAGSGITPASRSTISRRSRMWMTWKSARSSTFRSRARRVESRSTPRSSPAENDG